jgi:hypothetical protein
VTQADGDYEGGETPRQICDRLADTDANTARREIFMRFGTDAPAVGSSSSSSLIVERETRDGQIRARAR